MAGRNDSNIKVIVPNVEIPRGYGDMSTQNIKMGDYVVVQVIVNCVLETHPFSAKITLCFIQCNQPTQSN